MDYNNGVVLSAILPIQVHKRKGNHSMTKEEIYERMTVQMTVPDPDIPCECDEGRPCELLYDEVCAARERIAERTGLDFEGADLLAMVEGMEEIAKICGLKMFEYGKRFGRTGQ